MTNTRSVGDECAGFSVALGESSSTIRVRAWGFWSPEVASAFASVVGEACSSSPQHSALVIDTAELRPMCREGQDAYRALMDSLPDLHLASITVLISSQLLKLQLLRLTNESAAKGAVQFVQARQAHAVA